MRRQIDITSSIPRDAVLATLLGPRERCPESPPDRVLSTRARNLAEAGHTLRLPDSSRDWDIDAAAAFEAGKIATMLKAVLGADQWQMLNRLGAKLGDLEDIAEQIATAYGFESTGESGASSD